MIVNTEDQIFFEILDKKLEPTIAGLSYTIQRKQINMTGCLLNEKREKLHWTSAELVKQKPRPKKKVMYFSSAFSSEIYNLYSYKRKNMLDFPPVPDRGEEPRLLFNFILYFFVRESIGPLLSPRGAFRFILAGFRKFLLHRILHKTQKPIMFYYFSYSLTGMYGARMSRI